MRIGILGGTFDPVHNAHLLMAEQCREQCELDQIWFIPAGNPPHKEGKNVTSGKQRREMLDFAIAGHPAFLINDLELHREGPSYTVVTVQPSTGKSSGSPCRVSKSHPPISGSEFMKIEVSAI